MHCVLLGVFPEVLKLCYKTLTAQEKEATNQIISTLSCPREMIAYSRKIRSVDEIGQFKANEYFNWLFYVSPLVFRNRLPEYLYLHLSRLVFGVRILLESSNSEVIKVAEDLLKSCCCETVTIHEGDARLETINVQSLGHLADQLRRFGPLFCFSAMSFEAANRILGEVFSGSTFECEIICRRILQKHRLSCAEIHNAEMRRLFNRIKGLGNEESSFCDEMIETTSLKSGRVMYRGHFSSTVW